MSYKNKEEYNAYMKEYMLNRYHEQKQKLLNLLGNKCVKCDNTEGLEFDHIKPSTKSFAIAQLNTMSYSKALEEVKKCQLLCKKCHNSKSIKEQGFQEVKDKNFHGTVSSYRYCKYDLCKEAQKNIEKNITKEQVRNIRAIPGGSIPSYRGRSC
jgi:5-methylcytosine-specific restriction endonuclease McrA